MESLFLWSGVVLLLLIFIMALYGTHLLRRVDNEMGCVHDMIHFMVEGNEGEDEMGLDFSHAVVFDSAIMKNMSKLHEEHEAFMEKHGRIPTQQEIGQFSAVKSMIQDRLEQERAEIPDWKKWEQQD